MSVMRANLNLSEATRRGVGLEALRPASNAAQIQKYLTRKGLWLRIGRSGVRLSQPGFQPRTAHAAFEPHARSHRRSLFRKEQTHHMAPCREGARLFIDPVLPRQFFRQMRRDKFTKLMQRAAVMFGRRYVFHTADSLVGIRRRPPFFNPPERESHHILWDGCDPNSLRL